MNADISTIERAHDLARSGTCSNLTDIAKKLKQEGFESVDAHLTGSTIRSQLKQLCAEAKARRGDECA